MASEAQQMAKILSGTEAEKRVLFSALMEKAISGVPLEEHEIPVIETLKKLLMGTD